MPCSLSSDLCSSDLCWSVICYSVLCSSVLCCPVLGRLLLYIVLYVIILVLCLSPDRPLCPFDLCPLTSSSPSPKVLSSALISSVLLFLLRSVRSLLSTFCPLSSSPFSSCYLPPSPLSSTVLSSALRSSPAAPNPRPGLSRRRLRAFSCDSRFALSLPNGWSTHSDARSAPFVIEFLTRSD